MTISHAWSGAGLLPKDGPAGPRAVRRGNRTVERAYELAMSGEFACFRQLVSRLMDEGHGTALTDLRSRNLQSELRGLYRKDR
jgi:hypothetical protein